MEVVEEIKNKIIVKGKSKEKTLEELEAELEAELG
jgi:hypothetical protein